MTIRVRCLVGTLILVSAACDATARKSATPGAAGGEAGGAPGSAGGSAAGGAPGNAGGNAGGGAGGNSGGGAPGAASGGAAGSAPGNALDLRNGSRLTFPRWVTADGFAVNQGTIRDSQRGELCTFQRATDGQLRCLPAPGGFDIKLFADPACTEPLFSTNGAFDAGPYAVFDRSSGVCEQDFRLEYRELLAPFDGTQVYSRSAGACVAAGGPSVRDNLHRTGAVLSPQLFVAATEVVVKTGGGRLAELYLSAEDGAWMKLGLFDTELQTRCAAQAAADGELRCIPSVRYHSLLGPEWGQADCSGPGIAAEVRCSAGAPALVVNEPLTCPRRVHVHQAGAVWKGTSVYRNGDPNGDPKMGCVGASATSASYVEIGAELPADRFARLMLDRGARDRLNVPRYVEAGAGDGAARVAVSASAYDSVLDELCTFRAAPDGRIRCLPPVLVTAFRDPACSDAVGVDLSPDPCGAESALKYMTAGAGVYTRGPRLAAAPKEAFIVFTNGACGPADYYTIEDFRYFAAGPALSVELVEGTATSE